LFGFIYSCIYSLSLKKKYNIIIILL
jgi:hypothetical protein